jgi:hypothetical protein
MSRMGKLAEGSALAANILFARLRFRRWADIPLKPV